MSPLAVVGGLLGAAVVLVAVAPVILSRGRWQIDYPKTALALWHAAFLGGLASAAASLIWSMLLVTTMGHTHTGNWLEPTILVIAGWGGLAVFGAALALVMSKAEPLAQAERALHIQLSVLAATNRCHAVRGVPVVVIDSELPVAFSVSGEDARILVTTRLEQELTAGQLRAVIEHERAHVVQRHGLIAQLAQLNRSCVPVLPGARVLEKKTKFLIELIADDAAAKATGAANTANALVRVGVLQGDASFTLRARRIANRPPRGSMTGRGAVPEDSPVFS